MSPRRPLSLLLVSGLVGGVLAATPAADAADPPPDQTLVLTDTVRARTLGTDWTPTPQHPVYGGLQVRVTAGATTCPRTGTTIAFSWAGSCTVEVSSPGDDTHGPSNTVVVPFTVAGHQPEVTLAADPDDPVLVDQQVHLVATVDTRGRGAPGGTVQVVALGADDGSTADDQAVGSPAEPELVDGETDRATLTVPVKPESTTPVRYVARYQPPSPSVMEDGASDPLPLTADLRPVDLRLSTVPADLLRDATRDLVVSAVDPNDADRVVAGTGTVVVARGATQVSSTPWTGSEATVPLPTTDAGQHDVTVSFTPTGASFADPDDETASYTVRHGTTTSVTTDPASSTTAPVVGHPVAAVAEVTSSGHGPPTGTVQFYRLGSDDTADTDDSPVGDPQTLAAKPSTTDVTTARLDLGSAGTATDRYAARYTPAGGTSYAPSASTAPASVVPVRRRVGVVLDLDADVLAGDPVTGTITPTDLDPPSGATSTRVAPGSGTRVTVDGHEVTVDWDPDGTGSFTYAATGTVREYPVRVAFVPDQDATFATPDPVDGSFRAKHAQPLAVGVTGSAPYAVDTTVTEVVTGAQGTTSVQPLTTSVCTRGADGRIRLGTAGTCEIRYTAAGDDTYLSGSVVLRLAVVRLPVVEASAAPTTSTYGTEVAISATAKDGSTVVTGTGTVKVVRTGPGAPSTVLEPTAYTFGGQPVKVTVPSYGSFTATVTYDQPAAELGGLVGPGRDDVAFTVDRASQTVTLGTPPGGTQYVGQVWSDPATSSVAANRPTLSVVTTTPDPACRVGSDQRSVEALRPGLCTVTATRAQDDRYDGSSATQPFPVSARPVRLTVTSVTTPDDALDERPRLDAPVVVTVTATDGLATGTTGAPVAGAGSLRVTGPAGTVVEQRSVTFAADGTASIEFTPDVRGAHTVTASITPALVPTVIPPATTAVGVQRYQTVGAGSAVVDGGLSVDRGRQRIRIGTDDVVPTSGTVDEAWTIDARGGRSGHAVEAEELTPATCTVTGLVVTYVAATAAKCRVELTQQDSADYEAGSRIVEVTVVRRPVTVEVAWVPGADGRTRYHRAFDLTVTARDAGTHQPVSDDLDGAGDGTLRIGTQTVALEYVDGVAKVVGFVPEQVGTAIAVTADFTPDRDLAYQVTDAATTITLDRALQVITVAPATGPTNVGDHWDPVLTQRGDGPEPVAARTVDADGNAITSTVCEIVDGDATTPGIQPRVHYLTLGPCRVVLTQAASTYYEAGRSAIASVQVLPFAVAIDFTLPTSASSYATGASITATVTGERHGDRAPGTVTLTLRDRTGDCAAASPTSSPCETFAAAHLSSGTTSTSATAAFAAQKLLAGTYEVTATYVPATGSNFDAGARTTTFTLRPGDQELTRLGSPPSGTDSGRVTTKLTPRFDTAPTGVSPTLEIRPDSSLTNVPEYALAGTADWPVESGWTRPTTPCTVADGTISLLAAGTCRATARTPGVTRRWSPSNDVPVTVTVTRIPVMMGMQVSTDPAGGTPTVDRPLRLTASATTIDLATGGTVKAVGTGRVGTTQSEDLRLQQDWLGGGRTYTFLPAHAGRLAYFATFRPRDPTTYAPPVVPPGRTLPVEGTVTVAPFQQSIVFDDATVPDRVLVGAPTWHPTASGGRYTGARVVPVVDDTSQPGVCEATSDGGLAFPAHGQCRFTLRLAAGPDLEHPDYLGDVREAPPTELGGTGTPYEIAVEQTTPEITLDVPELRVGVPAEIVATVPPTLAGSGSLTLTVDGLTQTVDGAWPGGAKRLAVLPTNASTKVSVDASFQADDETSYALATASRSALTISRGVQTVGLGTDPGSAWVGETWTPTMTTTGSADLVRDLTATPSTACRLSGGTVSFVGAGSCTITGTVAQVVGSNGEIAWDAARDQRVVQVSRRGTTLSFTVPAQAERVVNEPFAVDAVVQGQGEGAGTVGVPGTMHFYLGAQEVGTPQPVDAGGFARGLVTLPPIESADWEERWRDGLDERSIRVQFVPNDPTTWQDSVSERTVTLVRRTAKVTADPGRPVTMPVGAEWTPHPTSTSPLPITVVPGATSDPPLCQVVDNKVRMLRALPGVDAEHQPSCEITYTQPASAEWNPVEAGTTSTVTQSVRAGLRDVTLTLAAQRGTVGAAHDVRAVVAAPVPAPAGNVVQVDTTTPTGSVDFEIGGRTYRERVDPATMTATLPFRPGTSGAFTVDATFVPDAADVFRAGTPVHTIQVEVDPSPTTTTVSALTPELVEATVDPTYDGDDGPSGTVTFSYSTPAGPVDLGRPVPVVGGVARLVGVVPPPDIDTVVTASYAGDDDYLADTGKLARDRPGITATVSGTAGWRTTPVTITFRCEPATAPIPACPAAVRLDRDGADQQVVRTITAADGGRGRVSVTDIDIDRTAPVIRSQSTADGVWYRGDVPAPSCRATDAVSGVRSCTVTRTRVAPGVYTDRAVAVDRAGNRTAAAPVRFEVRQSWVSGAPLVRGGFQVRRGSTVRLVTSTQGTQPQLMLPGKDGRLRPAKIFRASDVDDGVVTWYAVVTVPRSVTAGRSWSPGFRLADSPGKVTRIRLDVVRKPSGRPGLRGR